MARIPDGKNLIYRTNIRNFAINWLSNGEFDINNSTVYDMLPKLFHSLPALAFISKRDGRAQIYVQHGKNGTQAISAFDKYKVFRNLDISFDDEKLLASEANRIHIFDLTNLTNLTIKPNVKTINLENRVRSAIWLTKSVFAVTQYDFNQSTITLFNQNGKALKTLPSTWQSILVDSSNNGAVFLVDNKQNLHKTTAKLLLSDKLLLPEYIGLINHPVNRDTKINGKKLYQIPNKSEILQVSKISNLNKVIKTYPLVDSYGFDVVDNTLVFSALKYASTELHRTK